MRAALEPHVKHSSSVQRLAVRGTALAPNCSGEAQSPQDDQQQQLSGHKLPPKTTTHFSEASTGSRASVDAGFQISFIFSNKFMGEEGESSSVVGKDLWDSPCRCGRSCHMQFSSKCPRAAAHTDWTPHLPQGSI